MGLPAGAFASSYSRVGKYGAVTTSTSSPVVRLTRRSTTRDSSLGDGSRRVPAARLDHRVECARKYPRFYATCTSGKLRLSHRCRRVTATEWMRARRR